MGRPADMAAMDRPSTPAPASHPGTGPDQETPPGSAYTRRSALEEGPVAQAEPGTPKRTRAKATQAAAQPTANGGKPAASDPAPAGDAPTATATATATKPRPT